MNQLPPDEGRADETDAEYQRLSALDSSRPSPATRAAILAHAARLAAQRSGPTQDRPRRAARVRSWRPALFGTLAAATLAGLAIAPRLFTPPPPPSTAEAIQVPAAPARTGAPPALAAPPAAAGHETREAPAPEARRTARAPQPAAPAPGASTEVPRPAAPPLGQSAGVPASAGGAERAADALEKQQSPTVAARTSALAAPASASHARGAVIAESGVPFRHAAEIGDVAQLQTLLPEQADINARDALGRTALMLATLHGQANAVAALLAYGADPNAPDARGVTPAQAATAANQSEILAALRRYGAR